MTDGRLLARYARDRDGESFRLLLERHGAMVLAACRRLAGPDAEDAAQAVFLLVARKAGGLTAKRDLGPWLHRAATFVCGHAVRARERRRRREKEAAEMREEKLQKSSAGSAERKELRRRLDAALNSLPGRYREVMVLCYLQGASQSEAARRLGLPTGTVAARCARGLAKLRGRLSRRGVTLAAAALAGALAAESAAALPAQFVSSTMAAIGGAGAAGSPVAALAKGGMQAMMWAKIKVAAAVLAAATVLGGGGGFVAVRGLSAAEPTKRLNPTLVKMPANTWVKLRPKRNPAGRNYSGLCYGGGYIFYFGGGHFGHPGNDVELYDVAANKWIQATELENFRDADKWTHLPAAERKKLKSVIGGGSSGTWLSPKGRPLTAHTYQMQVWFPEEKAIYFGTYYLWAFYPEKRGPKFKPPLPWKQIGKTAPRGRDIHTWNMTYDPGLKTLLRIVGTNGYPSGRGVYVYDRRKNSWSKKFKVPTSGSWTEVYSTYDSARKLHVVHCGQRPKEKSSWWMLNTATGETKYVKDLEDSRAAAGKAKAHLESLSLEYDPATGMTLVLFRPRKAKLELWGYDPARDDWAELKLAGTAPPDNTVTSWDHMVYDPEHKCHLYVNQITPGNNARTDGVFAFRLAKGVKKAAK